MKHFLGIPERTLCLREFFCRWVDCFWNVMTHAQKPDFVFRRNGPVHLNRRGRQFSRLLAAEVCAPALVMLDTPRSEVEWEYWLPTPFASFPFSSPPVRHRVPSGFKRTLTCTAMDNNGKNGHDVKLGTGLKYIHRLYVCKFSQWLKFRPRFLVVTPCCLAVRHRRFGGTCLHLLGPKNLTTQGLWVSICVLFRASLLIHKPRSFGEKKFHFHPQVDKIWGNSYTVSSLTRTTPRARLKWVTVCSYPVHLQREREPIYVRL